jgi:hypothetical protein
MTRDDIIRIAQEAGAVPSGDPQEWDVWLFQDPSMDRFAALVAAEKDKEIKRLQDMLYEQLGELTALRAEKQMRTRLEQQMRVLTKQLKEEKV